MGLDGDSRYAAECCRELGLPDITTVVNSTDRTTIQLLAIANRVGKELRDRAEWPQLSKEYSFTLVSGQEGYPFQVILTK